MASGGVEVSLRSECLDDSDQWNFEALRRDCGEQSPVERQPLSDNVFK